MYSPFLSFQNAVYFIILSYFVVVLFTFYIQGVLKLKNNSGAKRLINKLSIPDVVLKLNNINTDFLSIFFALFQKLT